MDTWKELRIEGIAKIERRVAEFDVWELYRLPYGRTMIKILENTQGVFLGFTNIKIMDETGYYSAAVGFGESIEGAL